MWEQASGLHGIIRSLQLILWAFIKFGRILLSYVCWLLLFFFQYLQAFYICDYDNCVGVDCCVGSNGWLAWCYKAIYIHIESVYYFLKIWILLSYVCWLHFLDFNTCRASWLSLFVWMKILIDLVWFVYYI